MVGRRAFAGESQASTGGNHGPISAADLNALPMTPPALDRLIRTCLAKDPMNVGRRRVICARELKWIAEAKPQEAHVPIGRRDRHLAARHWPGVARGRFPRRA
jgi:hypothetical protein